MAMNLEIPDSNANKEIELKHIATLLSNNENLQVTEALQPLFTPFDSQTTFLEASNRIIGRQIKVTFGEVSENPKKTHPRYILIDPHRSSFESPSDLFRMVYIGRPYRGSQSESGIVCSHDDFVFGLPR